MTIREFYNAMEVNACVQIYGDMGMEYFSSLNPNEEPPFDDEDLGGWGENEVSSIEWDEDGFINIYIAENDSEDIEEED